MLKHGRKTHRLPTLLLLVGLGMALFTIFGLNNRASTTDDLRISASGPVCDGRCVHELDCCKLIKQNNDPYECAWPDRGWCFPQTCAPFEGQNTKCGWYWKFHNANDNEYHIGTNSPNGYGCMIGDSPETMRPICSGGGASPKPSSPLRPTDTVSPARKPNPTRKPRPTKAPTLRPTRRPDPTTRLLPTDEPFPTEREEPTEIPIDEEETPPPFDDGGFVVPTTIPLPDREGPLTTVFFGVQSFFSKVTDNAKGFWDGVVDFTRTIAP